MYTGSGTNNTSFLLQSFFYYKIRSMSFCNITLSHSSTSCAILGEMFTLKLYIITPMLFPYQPHSHRRYSCWTLYVRICVRPRELRREPMHTRHPRVGLPGGEPWTKSHNAAGVTTRQAGSVPRRFIPLGTNKTRL